MERTHRLWTDAPECYDGFGTQTVALAGKTTRGVVRVVEIYDSALTWQTMRYASGGVYIYATAQQWASLTNCAYPIAEVWVDGQPARTECGAHGPAGQSCPECGGEGSYV